MSCIIDSAFEIVHPPSVMTINYQVHLFLYYADVAELVDASA